MKKFLKSLFGCKSQPECPVCQQNAAPEENGPLKLACPWTTYYYQLKALFRKDARIKAAFDEDDRAVKLYADDPDKYWALTVLMPETVSFGNVVVKNIVIPANGAAPEPKSMTYREAAHALFAGNESVADIVDVENVLFGELTYVVFKPEVVQFFNDDLQDINGLCSTLNADICREILGPTAAGIRFGTAPADPVVGKPLGEWP